MSDEYAAPDYHHGSMEDQHLNDLLNSYVDKSASQAAQELHADGMLKARHGMYEFFKGEHGLGKFGKNDDGELKHSSFASAIEDKDERRKHVQDTLYKFALHGKAKELGMSLEEMAKRYDQMHEGLGEDAEKYKRRDLRKYLESHITDEMKQKYKIQDFNSLVHHMEQTNVLQELEQDGSMLKGFIQNYASAISPQAMFQEEILPVLSEKAMDDYDTFRTLINSKLVDYNIHLKNVPTAQQIMHVLGRTLPALASRDAAAMLKEKKHFNPEYFGYIEPPEESTPPKFESGNE